MESQKSTVSIKVSNLATCLKREPDKKYETLIIPAESRKGFFTNGKSGIPCSYRLTNVLRKHFEIDDKAIIFPLGNKSILGDSESPHLNDILGYFDPFTKQFADQAGREPVQTYMVSSITSARPTSLPYPRTQGSLVKFPAVTPLASLF